VFLLVIFIYTVLQLLDRTKYLVILIVIAKLNFNIHVVTEINLALAIHFTFYYFLHILNKITSFKALVALLPSFSSTFEGPERV
jgi:hypothetical protein